MATPRDLMLALCESPAEQAFVDGWLKWCRSINGDYDPISVEDDGAVSFGSHRWIRPQFVLGAYRLDFLISSRSCSIAVEIDGHQWHERTHADAAQQRRRDRILLGRRIITVRFAAIEVLDRPWWIAAEADLVLGDLEDWLPDCHTQIGEIPVWRE